MCDVYAVRAALYHGKQNYIVLLYKVPNRAMPNQVKPNQTMTIMTQGNTVLLCTTLHCSKPVYTDNKKIIRRWCGVLFVG